MEKIKSSLLYLFIISLFGAFIFLIIRQGHSLEIAKRSEQTAVHSPAMEANSHLGAAEGFAQELLTHIKNPLSVLILQIIAILFFGKVFGWLFKKVHQPSVIGEIVAGIVLGPSVIGRLFPHFSTFLFPPVSLQILQFLSQIGLLMFMFIIGMELNTKVLKDKGRQAVAISHVSIIFPYFLGVVLSYFLYPRFAPAPISFLAFSLFMGIAMSITAFPVLASIIRERNLTTTTMGAMAITCAAADDVTAWCILAAVIAIVKAGTIVNALFTIVLSMGYVVFMLYAVRPLLRTVAGKYASKGNLNKTAIAFMFVILLVSSYLTEIIGIHALFGGFLAGVIMPEIVDLKQKLIDKLEDVSIILLLPLFFVLTGLRTQIGLLNNAGLWLVCGVIIVVAVTGKFLGSSITARIVGLSWPDSLSIGALMNTRGLMELIVLNIGYDLGILSPEIFAMMVLMALATTCMTGPSLDLIKRFTGKKAVRY